MDLRERILDALERDQLRALTFIFPVQVDRRKPEEMRAALAAMPSRTMPVEGLLKVMSTEDLEAVCGRLGVAAGRSRAAMLGALLEQAGSSSSPVPARPVQAARPVQVALTLEPARPAQTALVLEEEGEEEVLPARPAAVPAAVPAAARSLPPAPVPAARAEPQVAPVGARRVTGPEPERDYTWDPSKGPPEPPDFEEPPLRAPVPYSPPSARSMPDTWAARSVEEHARAQAARRTGISALPVMPGGVRAVAAPKPAAAPVAAPKPVLAAPVAAPKPLVAAPVAAPKPAVAAPALSGPVALPVAAPASRPGGRRRNFTAIDFETADNGRDSACSVALVRVVGGEIVQVESFLIRPPRPTFLFTHIHGITWKMVQGEPTFAQRWPKMLELMAEAELLVAHNASFDRSVMEACCRAAGLQMVAQPFECTVRAAKDKWKLASAKLPLVCELLKIPLQHHDAKSDAMACAKIALAAGVDRV